MTINEFKDTLIKKGINSVQNDETMKPHEKSGSIEGFLICSKLNTPKDFEKKLSERLKEELSLRKEKNIDNYWEYRYSTIQIEFVYSIMKVAWMQSGEHFFSNLSARACLIYQKILVEKNII